MSIYLKSLEFEVWTLVVNEYNIPKDKEENDWDANEHKVYTANYKALNAIVCALSRDGFRRIFGLQTTKEAWDLLEVTHEGTNLVKQSKLHMLTSKFESLRMEEDEFIDFHTRLQDIVNLMRGLEEEVKDPKIIRKVLRSLPERFHPKVTAIEECHDLDKMNEELIGSIQMFELKLRPTSKKNTALKVNESSSSKEDFDVEFARKFKKLFSKEGGKEKTSKRSKFKSRRKELFKEDIQCYKCKGYGHVATKCTNKSKSFKKKKTFAATWDDSTNDSEEESSQCEEESS